MKYINKEYIDSQVELKHKLEKLVFELNNYVIPAISSEINSDNPDHIRLTASRIEVNRLLMEARS